MRLSLWASTQSPQVGRWSFCLLPSPLQPCPPALSAICPHHISSGHSRSANNPLLVKVPKSRITAHLHSFIPLFSRLWNKLPHSIQFHSSLQAFKTAVHHHVLSSPIQNLYLLYPLLIHSKPTSFKFPAFLPERPCGVHLVYPVFPAPFLSLTQIS